MLSGRGSAHVSSSYQALSLCATCGLRRRGGIRISKEELEQAVALVQQKKKARVERAHDDTDTDTERARARAAAFSTCEFAVRVQLRRCPVPVPMDGRHGSVVRSVDRSACCARLGSVWRLAGAVSMDVRRAPTLSTHKRPRKRWSPVSPMSRSECAGSGAQERAAVRRVRAIRARLLRVVSKNWRFLFCSA